jgi:hypothetical protein
METINEYYRAYISNIILLNQVFPLEFIEASECKFPEQVLTQDNSVYQDLCLHDNTLDDMAQDILRYGTYWLTVVDPEDNSVIEGTHRIAAMQMHSPYVPKKFACLHINPETLDYNFDEPKFYYMPISIIFDRWIEETIPDVNKLLNYENKRIARIYVDNAAEWVLQIIGLGIYLNRYIQDYQRISGLKFHGSQYLNDESLFRELESIDEFELSFITHLNIGGFMHDC